MKLELVIVDDSPLWLSLAEKLASAHPLVGGVLTFEDSYDAWIHIQIAKPQVVMADIEMPGMNGFSFLEMYGNRLPFISSSTKLDFEVIARELGCVDFIAKPFSKQAFFKSIDLVYDRIYGKRSA
ncbi:response regulator [Maribacter confluentis]|uniref:Response regulator receiver domain-containing protein n=2 Tax=Maribacter TaxID=252356 RepID=A0ABY1SGH7_9FLAO|nr:MULTISPECIES: response regulator [Maribacter]MDO1511123.1 response regulator [Maribacter confluentis]TVZ14321.1 two-component system chemotaxis response regulator CheB [Maribacter sp. MAR_2009_72]SNR45790.1 Response regulator receiver domain-containing protein [Maribacter sedimenticola]